MTVLTFGLLFLWVLASRGFYLIDKLMDRRFDKILLLLAYLCFTVSVFVVIILKEVILE
jgi:hypothetical protein